MAVEYEGSLSTEMILSDVEAHVDWLNKAMRRAFFPHDGQTGIKLSAPMSFVQWCKEAAQGGQLKQDSVDRLESLHNELAQSVKTLLDNAAANKPPTLQMYDDIEHRLDAYIVQLKRLGEDASTVGNTVDPVTGLRSVVGMRNDLLRELDRRERKGEPFCITAVQIDDIEQMDKEYDRTTLDVVISAVGNQIAGALRSFDDVYHLGDGEFLLCLKHVDLLDACSVMDRMRAMIAANFIDLPGGSAIKATASFGVAEPIPGDDIDTVTANAKHALREAQDAGGDRVEQFEEMSPLVQYARDVSHEGSTGAS